MTEHLRIADRHVRQDLAVEIDPGEAQRGHEPAVGNAGVARRGVDAGDPERPELPLASTAIAVRVAQGVHRRFAGRTYELVLRGATALGLREQLLVLLVCGNAALDPRHPLAPYLQVRKQLADELQIAFGHEGLARVTALPRR